MKIDLHSMTLDEAKRYLYASIETALARGDLSVEVVHGFNRGTRLKTWVQHLDRTFHPEIARVRPSLHNSGSSIVDLTVSFE